MGQNVKDSMNATRGDNSLCDLPVVYCCVFSMSLGCAHMQTLFI